MPVSASRSASVSRRSQVPPHRGEQVEDEQVEQELADGADGEQCGRRRTKWWRPTHERLQRPHERCSDGDSKAAASGIGQPGDGDHGSNIEGLQGQAVVTGGVEHGE